MSHGGNSKSARKRRQLAGELSQRMHPGDGDAAFRLLQRGRALRGIQKLGWRWRLAMANAARKRNHEELLAAKTAAAEATAGGGLHGDITESAGRFARSLRNRSIAWKLL
jgi:hypothetical protein